MEDKFRRRTDGLRRPDPPEAEAALVDRDGRRFPLRKLVVRIGRTDEKLGIYPDIDLSPLDPRHAVSRLHAQIRRRGERWVVVEENGVPNGTWVNNRRLRAGEEVPIKHGDSLRLAGIHLIFESVSEKRRE
jgi:pSer/pThr/pTyr-binding forkhead associated (FHA) protein